jgi:nicotinamide-nucleotide adenylyltransferase
MKSEENISITNKTFLIFILLRQYEPILNLYCSRRLFNFNCIEKSTRTDKLPSVWIKSFANTYILECLFLYEMRALYLGRFNPPHKGHIFAIEHILEHTDIDEIIILIGSGEKAYSFKNPFTGGERLEMVTTIVREHFNINLFYITAIPDINRNTIWAANVIDLVPSFDVVFTNNPLVQQLFSNLGKKEVREIPLNNREEFSGRIIREKMIKGEVWEHLVPEVMLPLIKQYKGTERMKSLSKTDEVT